MDSVLLSAAELPALDEKCPYDIPSNTYLHIYNFFRDGRHAQDRLYIIDQSTYDSKYSVITDEPGTYRAVGIYFTDDTVNEEKEYILFLRPGDLETPEAFQDAVSRQQNALQTEDFRYAVIEKTYSYYDSKDDDNQLIRSSFPNIIIMNRGFPALDRKQSIKLRHADRSYLDLSRLFNQHFFCSNSMKHNIREVYVICDEILRTKGKYDFYYLDTKKLEMYSQFNKYKYIWVYYSLAAYLSAVHGLHFEMRGNDLDLTLQKVRELTSREYNYLDDYIGLIKNPLDFGVIMRDGNLYFCIKDYSTLRKYPDRYRHSVSVLEVDFDVERKSILSNDVRAVSYSLDILRTESIENLYQITSDDWGRATDGFTQLNGLVMQFENILHSHMQFNDKDSLCLSNILLFKGTDGNYRLSYVSGVKGRTPYYILPVDCSFSLFTEELQVSDYNQIYDIGIMQDGGKWVNSFLKAKYITGKNIHYRYPSHAKGIIMSDISIIRETLSELEGDVDFGEIGIWLPMCSQFRSTKANKLYSCILPSAARREGLITYFGGPMTLNSTKIMLGPRSWR